MATIEGSVGEECFYTEYSCIDSHDKNFSATFFSNNPRMRSDLERGCCRVLMHLCIGGHGQAVRRALRGIGKVEDSIAKDILHLIFDEGKDEEGEQEVVSKDRK